MSIAKAVSRDTGGSSIPRIDRPLAIAGLLAGIGAIAVSSCCALPLAFAAVGIGAGWLGELEAFSAYRPVILGVAGLALAAGWVVFIRRQRVAVCGVDGTCAAPSRRWFTGGALALATVVFGAAVAWGTIEGPVLAALIRLQ